MRTFHIWTIGCQMNTADPRRVSQDLERQGFTETDASRSADLVVLYSCMVRQHAEDKIRNQLADLRRLKLDKPATRIAVAGCVGDVDAWHKQYPFVDFFLEPGTDLTVKDRLADLVEIDQFYRLEPEDAARAPRVSEGITIHQGCNRNCTFRSEERRVGKECRS